MIKEKNNFSSERGFPLPGGAVALEDGINFTVFSRHATAVTLVLQLTKEKKPSELIEIHLDSAINRTGDIWHILLKTKERDFCYGYRMDGERAIEEKGLIYDTKQILLDPFCQNIQGRAWGEASPGTDVPYLGYRQPQPSFLRSPFRLLPGSE